MLRISRLADYGVVVSTRLAALPEGALRSVRELSEETGIPQPTVAKILKRLSKGTVVTSERGARGGYRLTAPAEETSIARVITALEGPIGITECVSGDEDEADCAYLGRCDVHGNWQRINEAIDHALRGITLAEMARPPAPVLVQLGLQRRTEGRAL
jgi:FeS assembly SUF system regulator